jgi:hypothetical protein
VSADQFHPREFRRGLRHAWLTDAEYRIAVELCEFAGIGKPVVWPSVPTLAENCCMKDRGVQYILGRLETKGVIVCVTRSKGGRGQTSRWQLLVRGFTSDTVSDSETVHSHAPFTDPETVHGGDQNGAPARTKTVHGHAPEVVKEVGRSRGSAPPPALMAAGALPTKARADAASTLPLNHDDVMHLETWPEWAAGCDLPVERPGRFCERHPRGGAPCGGCRDRRLLDERWEQEHADWKEDSRDQRAEIKACTHCNEHGQYTDHEGLWWCEHHGPPSSVSANPNNIRSLISENTNTLEGKRA